MRSVEPLERRFLSQLKTVRWSEGLKEACPAFRELIMMAMPKVRAITMIPDSRGGVFR